jgi:hypothetical protein
MAEGHSSPRASSAPGTDRPAEASNECLNPAEALDVLCANNLDLVRDPLVALEAFAWLAATVPMWVVRYQEASTGAAAVLDHLRASEPLRDVTWEVIAPTATPSVPSFPVEGGLRPSAQVVTVHIGDRTVLYDGATRGIARLNPAGSDTWRRILDGGPLDAQDRPLVNELESLGILVRPSG